MAFFAKNKKQKHEILARKWFFILFWPKISMNKKLIKKKWETIHLIHIFRWLCQIFKFLSKNICFPILLFLTNNLTIKIPSL